MPRTSSGGGGAAVGGQSAAAWRLGWPWGRHKRRPASAGRGGRRCPSIHLSPRTRPPTAARSFIRSTHLNPGIRRCLGGVDPRRCTRHPVLPLRSGRRLQHLPSPPPFITCGCRSRVAARRPEPHHGHPPLPPRGGRGGVGGRGGGDAGRLDGGGDAPIHGRRGCRRGHCRRRRLCRPTTRRRAVPPALLHPPNHHR